MARTAEPTADGAAELLHVAYPKEGGFGYRPPHENTVGDGYDDTEQGRLKAAAGQLVPGWIAASYLGIKPGTLRVWAHRGKLTPACYQKPGADDIDFNRNQTIAMYRLADIFAYADAHGIEIDYY